MRNLFSVSELQNLKLAEPFDFTKGCQTMKIESEKSAAVNSANEYGTLLFDLKNDPEQKDPINDSQIEEKMIKEMTSLMKKNDAPEEQYQRLGLNE